MHNDDAIDQESGEAKKPEIVSFYNLTKGAVDVVDEMSATYSTARICKRWPMVVFFSILNTAAINARVLLLSSKNPPTEYSSRRRFLKDLAIDLTKEQIKMRSLQPSIPRQLRDELKSHSSANHDLQTPDSNEPPNKKLKTDRKRCYLCPNVKDRKSKTCCAKCKKNICSEHTIPTCTSCY